MVKIDNDDILDFLESRSVAENTKKRDVTNFNKLVNASKNGSVGSFVKRPEGYQDVIGSLKSLSSKADIMRTISLIAGFMRKEGGLSEDMEREIYNLYRASASISRENNKATTNSKVLPSWDEYMEAIKKRYKRLEAEFAEGKKVGREWKRWQKAYLLSHMYAQTPGVRDAFNDILYLHADEAGSDKYKNTNYITFVDGEVTLYLNTYKTVNVHGKKVYRYKKPVGKLFSEYLKLSTGSQKKGYNSSLFTNTPKFIKGILVELFPLSSKELNGIGTSYFRHAYVNRKIEGELSDLTPEQRVDLSNMLLHSTDMAGVYMTHKRTINKISEKIL